MTAKPAASEPMTDERLAQLFAAAYSPFPFAHPATQIVADAVAELVAEVKRLRGERDDAAKAWNAQQEIIQAERKRVEKAEAEAAEVRAEMADPFNRDRIAAAARRAYRQRDEAIEAADAELEEYKADLKTANAELAEVRAQMGELRAHLHDKFTHLAVSPFLYVPTHGTYASGYAAGRREAYTAAAAIVAECEAGDGTPGCECPHTDQPDGKLVRDGVLALGCPVHDPDAGGGDGQR